MQKLKSKRPIALLLTAIILLAALPLPAAALTLVPPDDWARVEVNAALDLNIIPDSLRDTGWTLATTRLTAAEALVRTIEKALGQTAEQIASSRAWDLTKNGFPDTDSRAVTFLKYAGIVNGMDGKFEPNGKFTRAQAVTMIGRAAEVFFGHMAKGKNPFVDVPDWAADYVGYAAERGITIGTTPGLYNRKFEPDTVLNGQTAVVFMYRAYMAWKSLVNLKVNWSAVSRAQLEHSGYIPIALNDTEIRDLQELLAAQTYQSTVPYGHAPGWDFAIRLHMINDPSAAAFHWFMITESSITVDDVTYIFGKPIFQLYIDRMKKDATIVGGPDCGGI